MQEILDIFQAGRYNMKGLYSELEGGDQSFLEELEQIGVAARADRKAILRTMKKGSSA